MSIDPNLRKHFNATSDSTKENCGKGFRISSSIGCDDGNLIDGDGCSKDCTVEENFVCKGGSLTSPDICVNAAPVTFSIKELSADDGVFMFRIDFSKKLL